MVLCYMFGIMLHVFKVYIHSFFFLMFYVVGQMLCKVGECIGEGKVQIHTSISNNLSLANTYRCAHMR